MGLSCATHGKPHSVPVLQWPTHSALLLLLLLLLVGVQQACCESCPAQKAGYGSLRQREAAAGSGVCNTTSSCSRPICTRHVSGDTTARAICLLVHAHRSCNRVLSIALKGFSHDACPATYLLVHGRAMHSFALQLRMHRCTRTLWWKNSSLQTRCDLPVLDQALLGSGRCKGIMASPSSRPMPCTKCSTESPKAAPGVHEPRKQLFGCLCVRSVAAAADTSSGIRGLQGAHFLLFVWRWLEALYPVPGTAVSFPRS